MSSGMQGLLKNLDRDFFMEAACRQERDPSMTSYRCLQVLAHEQGIVPEEQELAERERRMLLRKPGLAREPARAARLRHLARETWALDEALRCAGVRVEGPGADILEKFFDTTQSTVLFPAYVEARVMEGMLEASLASTLVTEEIPLRGHHVNQARLVETDADRRAALSGEGARPVTARVRARHGTVSLHKLHLALDYPYEALRLDRLDLISHFFRRVGAQLALDETADLLQTAVQGDGNPGSAAPVTPVSVPGTFDYRDLVRLSLAFPPGYTMGAAVLGPEALERLLTLPEMRDPRTGLLYQATGSVPRFFGARWHRWSDPSGVPGPIRIVALDPAHALVQYTERALMVESQRLIDRQVERTVISRWTGFGKLDYHAVQVLEVGAAGP